MLAMTQKHGTSERLTAKAQRQQRRSGETFVAEVGKASKSSATLRDANFLKDALQGQDESNVQSPDKQAPKQNNTPQLDSSEELRCLNALKGHVDYTLQKNRNDLCTPDSGQWFFQNRCYEEFWAGKGAHLLFVTAEAGGGKSTVMRTLVDDLQRSTDGRLVAFFFFKDDSPQLRSYEEALSSLVYQFLVQDRSLIKYVKSLCDRFGDGLRHNTKELWNALLKIATHAQQEVLCVLDAIDECEAIGRKQLVADLQNIFNDVGSTNTHIRLVVSSRPYQDEGHRYDDLMYGSSHNIHHLPGENAEIKSDLQTVIRAKVELLVRKRGLDSSIQKLLIEKLSLQNEQTRSFLAIRMAFELLDYDRELVAGIGEQRIDKILARIPRSLGDQFDEMLNKTQYPQHAHAIFSMILASRKTIKIDELKVIYALTEPLEPGLERPKSYEGLEELRIGHEDFKQLIRARCGLFITFVGKAVHLFHQTAREYLLERTKQESASVWESVVPLASTNMKSIRPTWKNSISLADANIVCAEVCLQVLGLAASAVSPTMLSEAFDSIEAGNRCNHEIERFITAKPLAVYAALNWYEHVQLANPHGSELFKHTKYAVVLDISMPQFWCWFLIAADYLCDNSTHQGSYKTTKWPVSTIWSADIERTGDFSYFLRRNCLDKMFPMDRKLIALFGKESDSTASAFQENGPCWKAGNGLDLVDRFHLACGELESTSSIQAIQAIERGDADRGATLGTEVPLHHFLWSSILVGAPHAFQQALSSTKDLAWLIDVPEHIIYQRHKWRGWSSMTGKALRASRLQEWKHAYPPSFVVILRSTSSSHCQEMFEALANWVESTPDRSDAARQVWEAGGFIVPSLASRLVANGVAIDCQLWKDRRTALQVAATFWVHDAIQSLLKLGASPAKCTSHGYNALHWFSYHEQLYLGQSFGRENLTLSFFRPHYRKSSIASSIQALAQSNDPKQDPLNQKCDNGETPLMHAVQSSRSSSTAVKALLAEGALINTQDTKRKTALMKFFRNPRFCGTSVSVLRYLLQQGADPRDVDRDGCTAMSYWASRIMTTSLSNLSPGFNIYNLSFDALANIGPHMDSGLLVQQLSGMKIALVTAAKLGNAQLCAALLAAGTDPNGYEVHKECPLISGGPNGLENMAWNPLMVAVSAKAYTTAILLMEHGAGVQCRIRHIKRTQYNKHSVAKAGITPLHLVFATNNTDWNDLGIKLRASSSQVQYCSIQEVLEKGQSISRNASDVEKQLEALCYRGAGVDIKDQEEDHSDVRQPLCPMLISLQAYLMQSEYEKVRDDIVNNARGANLLPYDTMANVLPAFQFRDDPLINAIIDQGLPITRRKEALVEYMLLKGVQSNATTLKKITPLYLATTAGMNGAVQSLLRHGADPNISTARGCTPLMMAAKSGNHKIVRQLLEAGATVDAQLSVGEPQKCCCRNFLVWKKYPFPRCEAPLTALAIAADHGHAKVVELLLHAGADPNLEIIHHAHGWVHSKQDVHKAQTTSIFSDADSDSESGHEYLQWKGFIGIVTAITFAGGECRDMLLRAKAVQKDSFTGCDCKIDPSRLRELDSLRLPEDDSEDSSNDSETGDLSEDAEPSVRQPTIAASAQESKDGFKVGVGSDCPSQLHDGVEIDDESDGGFIVIH